MRMVYRNSLGQYRLPTMQERRVELDRLTERRRRQMTLPFPVDGARKRMEDAMRTMGRGYAILARWLAEIARAVWRWIRRPPRRCSECNLVLRRQPCGYSGFEWVWICPGCRKGIEE